MTPFKFIWGPDFILDNREMGIGVAEGREGIIEFLKHLKNKAYIVCKDCVGPEWFGNNNDTH